MIDLKMIPQYITVEGINGSGKTTFLDHLQCLFDEEGIPHVRMEMMPNGPLREVILGDGGLTESMRLLLIRTLSLQVQKDVKRVMQKGKWVLMDRGWLSYLVYQGQTPDLRRLRDGLERSLADPFPKTDFTIYLDVSVRTALWRRMRREAHEGIVVDHFESNDQDHENMLHDLFITEAGAPTFIKDPENLLWLDTENMDTLFLAQMAFDEIKEKMQSNFNRYLEHQKQHG